MSRIDLVSDFFLIGSCSLSKSEKNLLEVNLLILIYRELYKIFKNRYEHYFKLLPKVYYHEDTMLAINFTQEMIKDILSTEEYSLAGIAIYTNIPEEVLFDLIAGINTNPTFEVSRKLFELHMMVRRELYKKIFNKILSNYLPPDPIK